MKLKNTIMKIIIALIVMAIGIGSVISIAYDDSTTKTLKLSYYRYTYSESDGYVAGNGYAYNTNNSNHKPIFQILEMDGSSILSSNYYCLNATVGDSWYSGTIGTETTYDVSYNLDDEDDIDALKKVTSTNSVYSNIANSEYLNEILWILDNMYVPDTTATDEENLEAKMNLLAQAGIVYSTDSISTYVPGQGLVYLDSLVYDYTSQDGYNDFTHNYSSGSRSFSGFYNYYDEAKENRNEVVISDDIVEAAQQAALWYFTNYLDGDKEDGYNVAYDETEGLLFRLAYGENDTLPSGGYTSLTDYDIDDKEDTLSYTIGELEEEQAAILCAYLIEAAEHYASTYTSTSSDPLSISPATSDYETVDVSGTSYYVVGPITISEENNTTYTLENTILVNGTEVSDAYLSDKDGVATGKTVQASVGSEFYVAIPVSEVNSNNITIGFEGSYTTNQKTLWISSTGEEQPVVEVGPNTEPIELEVTVVLEKEFDLALRKKIVSLTDSDGNSKYVYNEAGNTATRELTYDTDSISSTGTATYDHRKDPVVVETGDIVTYEITVYNEGDIAGYATTIVDKLPEGLALAGYTKNGTTTGTTTDGNYSYVYDPTTNTITFTNVNKNVLDAYVSGSDTLSSETIQIDCEVVAIASSSTNTYLTNIAYITGEYNSEDGEEVTKDRDSSTTDSPDDKTQVTTGDDYDGYTGGDDDKDVYSGTDNKDYFPGEEDDDDFEIIVIPQAEFDLALQKYISSIYSNGTEKSGRSAPTIDTTDLKSGDTTTATYTQDKSVITVENGDYVVYTFTVYNEGEVNGYVNKITDNIPSGLEFVYIADDSTTSGTYEVTVCDSEGNASTIEVDETTYNLIAEHNSYWAIDANDDSTLYTDTYNGETTISVTCDVEAYLGGTNTLLNAFDSDNDDGKGSGLSSVSVTLVLRVSDTATAGVTIRNEAAITEAEDEDGNIQDKDDLEDRDSQTDEWPGKDGDKNYQDDEDYDNIQVNPLGTYDLILIKEDEDGEELDSTATFEVNGTTYEVTGRLVIADDVEINSSNVNTVDTYTIVETIAPDGYCEFDGTINIKVTKQLSEDGTTYEVKSVTYTVTDENGNEYDTEDATVYLKDGNIYVEVVDYEEVVDLALTKFIVAVSDDLTIDDGEWLTSDGSEGSSSNPYTRATSVDTTDLRDDPDCHDATYNMIKDPLTVPAQSYVLYNIRVYNEGDIDVYAGEITDYLPTYLDFVECDFNTAYGWTVDSDGKTIRTTYLAYEEGSTTNLLKAFDKTTDDGAGSGLDYRDVQVLCRVNDSAPTNTNITNVAEITEYQDEDGKDIPEDEDSTPDNVNEENEDDDDYEVILIQTFDLSLLKYVTTVYVTVDGTTETIETGNVGDENDTIPKVEINRKKIDSTIVIFEYTIKITNEGDIAGSATEITDYVPEGLKYYAEDNEDGVWTDEGNNVISTRALEGTILEPGESATVTVKLRWINGSDNLGFKTNTAEISEDWNEPGIPDRDSTPDNQVEGEDDIDDAQVLLSISTGIGKTMTYVGAVTLILVILGTGIMSIKKYVL